MAWKAAKEKARELGWIVCSLGRGALKRKRPRAAGRGASFARIMRSAVSLGSRFQSPGLKSLHQTFSITVSGP